MDRAAAAKWERVKFGEVVRLSRETCKDPASAGVERAIGLEHLEPDDLRIRTWDNVSEGTTFSNRVRPGQVLFGKRRAYQRKVAVAGFDAVCSGDIYVLESRSAERLLPELLPFLCLTEAFLDHAVGTSVGSLSPRTSWSSLSEYEFPLPPLAEQRRAALALSAASYLLGRLDAALLAHQTLYDVMLQARLTHSGWRGAPTTSLGSVCTRVGVGIASSASHAYRSSGVPFIRNTNIKAGRIDTSEILYVDPAYAESHRSKRIFTGDVVMTRTATDVPGDAAVVHPELDGAQAFTILVCTPDVTKLDSEYLCHWINGRPGRAFIRSRRGGAKQQNLGATFLAEMPIVVPSLDSQRRLVAEMRKIDAAGQLIGERLVATRRMISAMREDAFGK